MLKAIYIFYILMMWSSTPYKVSPYNNSQKVANHQIFTTYVFGPPQTVYHWLFIPICHYHDHKLLYCSVVYSIEHYCIWLHYTTLYYTVIYCTHLYYTVLQCTVLYCTVLHCTELYYTTIVFTELIWTLLPCTAPCTHILYSAALY